MQTALNNFCRIYNGELTADNLYVLRDIYTQDVVFCDPAHTVNGIEALIDYFHNTMKNLSFCCFDIQQTISEGNDHTVVWRMTFSHPRLRSGRPITLDGISVLRSQHDKIAYHRDYFDLGSMIYEHIPLLGGAVRNIKRGLAA